MTNASANLQSGAEYPALIYTILQTEKMNDLNAGTYLRNMLSKIAEGYGINRLAEPIVP
jgi:hypothetical protein